MSQIDGANSKSMKEAKLPRRDWILLPLISVLTAAVLAASLSLIGGCVFSQNLSIGECIIIDPVTGERGVPNRVCTKKTAESQPVEYRFNSCGYRAGMECGPKPPDTYRIVMAGTSYPFGWTVKREDTFAAMLPVELSRRTGRKVELYNESMIGEGGIPRNIALRFNEILAAQPDVILWMVTPWELERADRAPRAWEEPGPGSLIRDLVKNAMRGKVSPDAIPSIVASIQDRWVASNSGILIQHYLYEFESLYVNLYLERESQTGFLRAEPNPLWQYRLQKFDQYAADIEGRAKAAGVPIVVALLPDRVQVAMISSGDWPAGYDPYKLGEELRAIVTSHGGTYIDTLQYFRAIPNAEQYYQPIDNHPNAGAHAIFNRILARELTSGAVPALKAVGP